jgi:hypothetical protein
MFSTLCHLMPPDARTYARQPLSNHATLVGAFDAGRGAAPFVLSHARRGIEC